jgi:D-glycero-D-manno-heptose 1,7-bisphosphate phosphatase
MAKQDNAFVMLDRDGVINRDLAESVRCKDDFVLLPRVPEAIATLNRAGFRVLVITNQACVGRGELGNDELARIHENMQQEIRAEGGNIERIYVCPHTDDDGCRCRKPKPGLILEAQQDFGFEPQRTWMVGDTRRDIEAAISAGCRPALVRSNKQPGYNPPDGVPVFDNLMQFARQTSIKMV